MPQVMQACAGETGPGACGTEHAAQRVGADRSTVAAIEHVEVIADELMERGEIDDPALEVFLEASWSEGGTVDELGDARLQRELNIRRITLIEAGVVDAPDDVDEELRLYRLYEQLKAWRRDWWRLRGPGPSKADNLHPSRADELPDELEVEVAWRDGERRTLALTRGQVDRLLERGHHTLVEHRAGAGVSFELQTSRSVTRALGTDGKIIEER